MKKQKENLKAKVEDLENTIKIQQEEINKLKKKTSFQKWINLFLLLDK